MNLQSRLGILIALALLSGVSVSSTQHRAAQASSSSSETEKLWRPITSQTIPRLLHVQLSQASSMAEGAAQRIVRAAELEAIADDPTQILDEAIQIAAYIEAPELYSYIALRLMEVGQDEQASQLFDRAIHLLTIALNASDSADLKYDRLSSTRNVAVDLAVAGRFDQALKLTEILPQEIHRVGGNKVEIWTEIAILMAEDGQNATANALLSEALELAQSLTDGHLSNGSCYIEKGDALAAVVDGLSAVSRRTEALNVSEDTPSCFDVYGQIAGDYQAYAYSQLVSDSTTLVEVEEVISKIQLTVDSRTGEGYASVAAAARRLVELGEIGRALQVVELIEAPPEGKTLYDLVQLKARGYRDDLFVAIAIALADAGKFERAMQIAENIVASSSKSVALINMSEALNEAGQPEQADEVFSQAMSILFEDSRIGFTHDAGLVALALTKAEKIDEALWAAAFLANDYQSDSLRLIAVELVRLGYVDAALQTTLFESIPVRRAKLLASIATEMVATQNSGTTDL